MNHEKIHKDKLTGKEILREESPHRLIELFKEQTGMRSLEELEASNHLAVIPVRESYAKIAGAVVIGSCTQESSRPKDLDVIVVGNLSPSGRIADYVYELGYSFDMEFAFRTKDIDENVPLGYQIEQGRIDILDYVYFDQTDIRDITQEALRRTDNPKIFSYTLEQAEEIKNSIEVIKNE